MEVQELYKLTKAIMFEKPTSTIYDNYVIGNVNMLLAELFDENNMSRAFKGKRPYTRLNLVESMDDEILLEDEYANEVLPYGLASRFFIDDDLSKFNLFDVQYQNARIKHKKIVSKKKLDAINS